MYTNVHMNYILPITDLRKNIFTVMDHVARNGDIVEVEREGKKIAKIVPLSDDAAERAEHLLTHVLPHLKGVWKDKPVKRNTAVEQQYWKRDIFS